MIKITGNDIKELNDTDLRSLIALLCEAELRAQNIPTAGVTWGGNQTDADGGLDVKVEVTSALLKDSYIPKSKTGFQVKKPDMPPCAIKNEMRPAGILRAVIKKLVDDGGAYIIVSGQGSTADSALKNRKEAMRQVILDAGLDVTKVKLDFYDRERVAGWVRSHPAMIIWVKEKIGKAVSGWKAYENWAKCPDGIIEEYILDEQLRVYDDSNDFPGKYSAIDGMNRVRCVLQSGEVVRLVGLSGVGKTRFLQALFDDRIGENPLNQSKVFYADMSNSPEPDPVTFAENLIAFGESAFLAIDNCPPELHRTLTDTCLKSQVSLITIEYDVRADQPEETIVFRLEPSSDELIERLIKLRFKNVSQLNAKKIAEFSGGNARIAIALARTVKKNEILLNLKDDVLFERLFKQRNELNNGLLKAAEVCSLVYSFEGENSTNELMLLSSLRNMSPEDLYENISELKRRELVQQRGIWKAVLPHAIANKLAQRALENIPLKNICNVFEGENRSRLLKSFSRRIGYLHECDKAIEISKNWLSEGGLLDNINNLDANEIILFKNIAPVNPKLVLNKLEKMIKNKDAKDFFSKKNLYYIEFSKILQSIAYDANLFPRAVKLLVLFALSERPKETNNSIRYILRSLFFLKLSGTNATLEQRYTIIKTLIESKNHEECLLGAELLDASLKTCYFRPTCNFEFGARSRDYGYEPNCVEEYTWYKRYIEYASYIIVNRLSVMNEVENILAEKFRGLWRLSGIPIELESAVKKISEQTHWNEGWAAIITTKKYDSGNMTTNSIEKLNELDTLLKPVDLIDKVRFVIFSNRMNTIDMEDFFEDSKLIQDETLPKWEKRFIFARSLGKAVASDKKVFNELLSDMLTCKSGRLFFFGQGLYDGCSDPIKVWLDFRKTLAITKKEKQNVDVLCGFINSLSQKDKAMSEKLLDEAVCDKVLADLYPLLQANVAFTKDSLMRIKQSIKNGTVKLYNYRCLAQNGNEGTVISNGEWCEILRLILSKPEGIYVVIDMLEILINPTINKKLDVMFILLVQEVLTQYDFSEKSHPMQMEDYYLAGFIKVCFEKNSSEETIKNFCNKFVYTYTNSAIMLEFYPEVLRTLIETQPIAFLDAFLQDRIDYSEYSSFGFTISNKLIFISDIDTHTIIKWCKQNPSKRYPLIAMFIIPFHSNSAADIEWTPLAVNILKNYTEPIQILNKFKTTLRPNHWSGSRSEIMKKHLKLIEDLEKDSNLLVVKWAKTEGELFSKEIDDEYEWEVKNRKKDNERFEY